ncbi:betaine--homocysteine S-methyltransferase [uncultured Thiothrix sp.]|uniref:betaine--homocysteine S-methyltransferase n=1 Tax=uncultured Thiothrix sp. TaxID=223185 RepID=UPI0026154502|nr:betaine--homocysteine S-methyltransferase [uncultured Thiothrix sp.]
MSESNLFLRMLAEKRFLLADGATGTNLFTMGLMTGDAPELWNAEQPEKIAAHYRTFVEAGSDIILTNTFGGNRRRLVLHQAQDRVAELNTAAVKILKDEIAKAGREIVVGGSMGPTGDILEPNGPLSIAEAADIFEEQARALAAAGVDVLWLETLSSKEEVEAAVLGAGRVGLPVVNTLSIDTNGRTMMGLTAADIINLQPNLHPHPIACGTNCGVGASEVVAAVLNFFNAAGEEQEPIIVAKANCGIPEYVDGKIVYNGTPELMARYVELAMDAGARIIGGCCGTSPEHIKAMRAAMDKHVPQAKPSLDVILRDLGTVSKGAQAQLAGDLSVEGGSLGGGGVRKRSRRA